MRFRIYLVRRTSFATKVGTTYIIEASGVVSFSDGKGDDAADPAYCFKGTCVIVRAVIEPGRLGYWKVDGTDFAYKSRLSYNSSHVYSVEFEGTGKPFEFVIYGPPLRPLQRHSQRQSDSKGLSQKFLCIIFS